MWLISCTHQSFSVALRIYHVDVYCKMTPRSARHQAKLADMRRVTFVSHAAPLTIKNPYSIIMIMIFFNMYIYRSTILMILLLKAPPNISSGLLRLIDTKYGTTICYLFYNTDKKVSSCSSPCSC